MKTKEKKNCWFFKNKICMKIYTHAHTYTRVRITYLRVHNYIRNMIT